MILDKNQDIIRCEKCKLIPLIDFYLSQNNIILLLKCRNNHEYEEDLFEYIDNKLSSLKNCKEDSKCQIHEENISLICKECNQNFCEKCEVKDCKTISINEYSLSKTEKENIENNINKYKSFIEEIKETIDNGVGKHSQEYNFLKNDIEDFLKINDYLIKFAKIIYFTFLNNENNLSYEIIENCKKNLNFNYKELSLNNYTKNNPDESLGDAEGFFNLFDQKRLYYNIINSYLNKNGNYILLPHKEEIDKSEIKTIKDMKYLSDTYEDWYYSKITELNDGRIAMSAEFKIDIFKINTLDKDLTINAPKIYDQDNKETTNFYFQTILGLVNGDLMTITEKTNITIYKIKENKYEISDTIKGDENIFEIIELHDNTILAYQNKKIIQYELNKGKYKKKGTLKNKLIPKGDSSAILKEFKDYSKILLYSDNKLIYFTMEGKFEFKTEIKFGYGILWDFLDEKNLIQGYGDIYIKNINSLKEVAYKECGNYEVESLCVLKDKSFLCGLSNRFRCILKQYIFKGKTIEEIGSKYFESYKNDFNNIYQLKNGNIVGTITTGEYFLFIQN